MQAKDVVQDVLPSDVVCILLKKADDQSIDFTVAMSPTRIEDENQERDVETMFCIAAGMIKHAKGKAEELFVEGLQLVKTASDLEAAKHVDK